MWIYIYKQYLKNKKLPIWLSPCSQASVNVAKCNPSWFRKEKQGKNTKIIPGKWRLNSKQHGARHHLRPRVLQSSEVHTFNCINHMAKGFPCVVGEVCTQVTLHGNRTQVVNTEGRLRPKGRWATRRSRHLGTSFADSQPGNGVCQSNVPKALKFQEAPERRVGFAKGEGGGYSWGSDSFWGPLVLLFPSGTHMSTYAVIWC